MNDSPPNYFVYLIYEAEHLSGSRYIVRPSGCLGTHGWEAGIPWQAEFVTGKSRADQIARKLTEVSKQEQSKLKASKAI